MRAAARVSEANKEFDPKELVVTTFSAKPPANGPSRDILWSEVWDTEHPLTLGYPFRWVLRKTDAKLRIRDLGRGDSATISHPFEDISLSALADHGPIELATSKTQKCWILIRPVPDLNQLVSAGAKAWSPNILGVNTISEAAANRVFRRSMLGVLGTMAFLFIGLALMPKPQPSEELIPFEHAKVLLSPAFKNTGPGGAAAAGRRGGTVNIVQAFQTATVQKTTRTLLSAGAAKALLSGSTLLNTAASSAAARKVFDSKSALATTGVPGSQNLEAKSTDVGMMGGRGGGTGRGAGAAGYGIGGGAAVEGQGSGMVSVGNGVGVSEGLTRDEVGKVIRDHMAEVRYCYESALIRSPGLEGKLVTSFIVRSGGYANAVKVKESSGDVGLDRCLTDRIPKWKFPKPRGGVDVAISYPFIFKSLGN